MNDIMPFAIAVPENQIEDLKARLRLTRWPDPETPGDWSQGVPLKYMQEIHAYWLHHYDWRTREALLNQRPQFKTTLDGLGIHFLHVRSHHKSARPLLLTHGWPGSIIEFRKVIEPLIDPVAHGGAPADAFHLVCPSLPGFGFSDKPTRPGWDVKKIARVWNDLMVRLGYESYFAQGGDWGSMITTEIGVQNRGNCKGLHINMPIVAPDPDTSEAPSELEQEALRVQKFYRKYDSGYAKQQSTRPQTLSYGLADSPIGQAAWILEKFYQWMDCQGNPEHIASRDELLDNVMMYWWPNAAASSAKNILGKLR